MNFKMYPVDMQKCEVKFESFGYQTNEVLLEWGAGDSGDFNEDINLPGYQHHVHMIRGYKPSGYEAEYSNLRFELHLIRRVEGACISALVPSFLFVIISYLALFVPHDVLVVRASICMFMLLTMSTLINSNRQAMPPLSYLSLLDIGLIINLGLIAACLLIVIASAFLRVKERESQALRLEQLARILFPVVFLGWAIFFFAYIFKINYDNLQTMNEKSL